MIEQLEEALDNEVLEKRNGVFVSAWGSTIPTGGKDSDAKDSVATRTAKRQINQRSILENAKSIFSRSSSQAELVSGVLTICYFSSIKKGTTYSIKRKQKC